MLARNEKTSIKVRIISAMEDRIPSFVHTLPMDKKMGLKPLEDDVALWTPGSPIMLDFPTGTGKNYFITHVLVPQAIAEGKNVLILSNRVALSVQQKLSLMKTDDSRRVCLTHEGIRQLEDLGNVRVLTYQSLAAFINDWKNKDWMNRLKYVVADEAHFFVADARFNADCSYLLHLVTSRFCRAIRIYLTATSWDVLLPLCEAEKRNYLDMRPYKEWEPPRSLIRYWIKPDYHHIIPDFFTDYSTIIRKIREEPMSKWLIFVDSKEKGRELLDSLADVAQYLDAEQKDSDTWCEVVEKGRFDSQVLITTSVLDNGVNIQDDGVKNIVIASDDRTAFIQSIGRKRIQPGEVVNVWVWIPGEKQISGRYARCKQAIKWEEKFSLCSSREEKQDFLFEIWRHGDTDLIRLFTPYCGRVFANNLAFYSIRRKMKFYERLMNGQTTFRDEVLQWLDALPEELPPLDAKLKEFYHQYGETALNEHLFAELRRIIVDMFVLSGNKEPQPKRIERLMGNALNNRLETLGLPYRIQSDGGESRLVYLEMEGGAGNA